MNQTIRLFLIFEGVAFAVAGSIHRGLLVHGNEHQDDSVAESTVAIVLMIGFGLS